MRNMRTTHSGVGRSLYLALAIAISTVAACGPFHRASDSQRALLYFSNESLDQATVFAVMSGGRAVRLGTVFAGRTDTLVVPPEVTRGTNVNVVARLLARNIRPQSGSLSIVPGDRFEVRLPIDEKTLVVFLAKS